MRFKKSILLLITVSRVNLTFLLPSFKLLTVISVRLFVPLDKMKMSSTYWNSKYLEPSTVFYSR